MTNTMSADEKINDLFIALTERYGAYELADGQSMSRIADSWAASIGCYSMASINLALNLWMRTDKKGVWPEQGQRLEMLRSSGCYPEKDDTTPAEWRQAELNGGIWYCHMLFNRALPDGWTRMDVSACIDAMLKRFHYDSAKSNAHTRLLARAWKAGAMTDEAWALHSTAWFASAKERTRRYHDDIARLGARRVHEALAAGRAA